ADDARSGAEPRIDIPLSSDGGAGTTGNRRRGHAAAVSRRAAAERRCAGGGRHSNLRADGGAGAVFQRVHGGVPRTRGDVAHSMAEYRDAGGTGGADGLVTAERRDGTGRAGDQRGDIGGAVRGGVVDIS